MIRSVEAPTQAYFQEEDDEHGGAFSPLAVLALVLRQRRVFVSVVGIGLALTLAIGLLKKRTYSSTFSFVPQTTADPRAAGLASLAGQFGVSLGGAGNAAQSPQFYADLLQTREVLVPIVTDSFAAMPGGPREPLAQLLDIRGASPSLVLFHTVRAMRERVIESTVATRTTGVVSVTVKTPSPSLSLQIAERLIAGLNQYNLATRQSQAGAERRFTEQRLAVAKQTLHTAEDALVYFLRTNRQFESAPELNAQYQRLQREVDLQRQVVGGLAQSYEDARIREVRDTPVVTVIERPVVAALPDPRGLLKALIAGFAASVGAALLAAVLRDAYARLRVPGTSQAYDALVTEWRGLRGRAPEEAAV